MFIYYLYNFWKKIVAEKLLAFSSGLYHTTIKSIESNVVVNQKFNDPKILIFGMTDLVILDLQ